MLAATSLVHDVLSAAPQLRETYLIRAASHPFLVLCVMSGSVLGTVSWLLLPVASANAVDVLKKIAQGERVASGLRQAQCAEYQTNVLLSCPRMMSPCAKACFSVPF